MPLDRFLSASLAGSSVSLNFKNWHHRICGDKTRQQPGLGPSGGHGPPPRADQPTSISSKLEGNLRSSKTAVWWRVHCSSSSTSSRYSCHRSCSSWGERGRQEPAGARPPHRPPHRHQGPPADTHVGLHPILHVRHTGHGVVQGRDVRDDGLLVGLRDVHICGGGRSEVPPASGRGQEEGGTAARTLRIQEPGHAQIPLRHREGLVQVLQVGLTIHLAHVDEHGPVGDVAGGAAGGDTGQRGPQTGQHTRT